jgi:hypothetical protein
LTEHQHKQMTPVRKTPPLCPVAIFRYNSPKLPLREKQCDLGEYVLSCMHTDSLLIKKSNIHNSNVGHRLYCTNH